MRTTLNYIQTRQLNNDSGTTPGGSTEPVTGLPISTGTNSGDFVELTDAQALALSDTSVGTLYGGVYMRVKRSATDTSTLALGNAVFWDRADTTDPYAVTMTSSTTSFDYAGTVIDPSTVAGEYCWIQINGRITAKLASGAVGDQVDWPITSTNTYTAAAAAAAVNAVGVQATAVASGLALVDVHIAQARY